MPGVTVVEHPCVRHKLAILRSRETDMQVFGRLLNELTRFMMYEATRDLATRKTTVTTPLASAGAELLNEEVVLVPVLRAGLGMLEGARSLMPGAKVGFVGLYRDENTLEPVEYYLKVPNMRGAVVILLDPMLATGGSLAAAISRLKERGAERVKVICVIASPEGIERVRGEHPDVDIFCAGIDERLDDRGFIIPGLGDCGDRLYGTM